MNGVDLDVRLTWPWRLIGPTFLLVAAAYPFLVTGVEGRPLDSGDIAPAACVAAIGVACWWWCAHAARVSASVVQFRGAFGKTPPLPWSEIASFAVTRHWIVVRERGGRAHRVPVEARGADAFADALRARTAGKTF